MAERNYLADAKRMAGRPQTLKTYRRIFVYARNKKGKSRFAVSAGVDKTLVIDPEHGTDYMKKLNPYVIHISSWEELEVVRNVLLTPGGVTPKMLDLGDSDTPFTWLAVDGMTRINGMALKYVMKLAEQQNLDRIPGLVDRRDYNKSSQLMRDLVVNLQALPMHIVYTAQERMISGDGDSDEDDGQSYMVADLPASPRSTLNSFAEVIGRLYTTRVKIKGSTKEVSQRRLQVGEHIRYDTGIRTDFDLPDVIKNPTLPTLVRLMLQGPKQESTS